MTRIHDPLRPQMALTSSSALLFALLLFGGAVRAWAEPAVVAVNAPEEYVQFRAYQTMILQALSEAGVATVDPASLQRPQSLVDAAGHAREAGADRLFALHLAPLTEGALLSLEEVRMDNLWTIHRASIHLTDEAELARVAARLVESVLNRQSLGNGQAVNTLTHSEGVTVAHLPGEFLYGVGVHMGIVPGADAGDQGFYGFSLLFAYETAHVQVGTQANLTLFGNNMLFEWSAMANYLFLDDDVSPFIGGGLGVNSIDLEGYDEPVGGHAIASVGAEFLRLHTGRFLVTVDVLFPFYLFSRRWYSEESYRSAGHDIPASTTTSYYFVVPRLTFTLAF